MRQRRQTYQRATYAPDGSGFPTVKVLIGAAVATVVVLGSVLALILPDRAEEPGSRSVAQPRPAASERAATAPTTVPTTPASAAPTTVATLTASPTPSPSPKPRRSTVDLGKSYQVLSVTDGDTIRVLYNGVSEPVRFIGIDTPETRNPNTPVECFGPEASAFATRLLSGQTVFLVRDGAQNDRDGYGRLLRFVFASDGTNVNETMVRRGYATFEDRYPIAQPYREELRRAEQSARRQDRGLWESCVNG